MEIFGHTFTIYEVAVRVIGILGIIFSVISFQYKKHSGIMLFRTLNESFFGVQYILLGAYTGAGINLLSCFRNVVFAERVKKEKTTLPAQIIFSVIFTVIGIITWEGPKSILIVVAKVISTFGYGMKNTKFLKITILFTASCWLVYNLFVGSIEGALCEAFTLCSIIVALIRMDLIPYIKKKSAR
ncbi:MAG: YgjV family protein [Clostridiales bacterium]|nr:YgjV family protein [Clostridiales bacterium]